MHWRNDEERYPDGTNIIQQLGTYKYGGPVSLENGTRYGKHEHEYEWVVYCGTGS